MDAELTEMHLEDQSERAEGRLSVLSLLSQRSLRWQLVSIIVMNMGQQLSGVNAVSPARAICLCPFFGPSNVHTDSLSDKLGQGNLRGVKDVHTYFHLGLHTDLICDPI